MTNVEFTEAETSFINTAVEQTKQLFPDEPLKTGVHNENINDVLVAVHAYHTRIGGIGEAGHAAMYSIFEKLGLCEDGLTTFAERDAQLKEARDLEVRNRAKLKDDLVAAYEKQIKHFQDKILGVQRTNEQIEKEIKDTELMELARVKIAITELRNKKIAEAERDHKKFLESLGVDEKTIPKPKQKPAPTPPVPSVPKQDPLDRMKGVDVDSLKYNELLTLASDLGIKMPPSLKKDDVVAMIKDFVKEL